MVPESGGMGYLLNYGIFHSDPGIWWNEWRRQKNVSFEPNMARIWSRARFFMRASCSTADLKSVQVRTQSQINLNNEIFSKNL